MTRNIRIGIFTAIGIAMIIGFSIFVNDHPYWYSACNMVKIHVDDATGLRRKSPVKTLGLDIGYIESVNLDAPEVLITVCVTGPVRLTAETRAYIRSQGFLGDMFLELKPVELVSRKHSAESKPSIPPPIPETKEKEKAPTEHDSVHSPASAIEHKSKPIAIKLISGILSTLIPEAHAEEQAAAEEGKTLSASRDGELQDMMKKAGKLLDQLTLMVGDLREVTQQKEFKEAIINLNGTLKNLKQILSPDGKIVQNLDASMESMRDMMSHAEQVMKKINSNEGTIGKFVNDPSIYDDLKAAIQSINLLLGKAGKLKTFVDLSITNIPAYKGNRGAISIMIQPNPTRYYLIGVAEDPQGKSTISSTTTSVAGGPPVTVTQNLNQQKGLLITALFGKYYGPLELKAGVINDDGAVGIGLWFDSDRRFGIQAEVYSPGQGQSLTARVYARAQIISALYLTGGMDSLQRFQNRATGYAGAGIFFDDDDLKYLLVFK